MTQDSPPAPPPPPQLPLPALADGRVHALDRGWLTLRRISHWIVAGVFGPVLLVGVLITFWLGSLSPLARIAAATITFGLLVLLGWWAHFWPAIDYRHRTWRLDERGLQVRRGVIWRIVVDVPRTRVQHTDVNQGPLERRLGLAHLVVHTAGTIGAMVGLDGLAHETASRIRDHLVKTERGDAV